MASWVSGMDAALLGRKGFVQYGLGDRGRELMDNKLCSALQINGAGLLLCY